MFSMLGSIGSAIIGGVTNLIGQKRANEANASEGAKNREFQTSEREAAQEWNLEQWNRQNEYNTPAEQMKRMIEAGINPGAAAQGISGAQNLAGSVAASQGQSGSLAAPMQSVTEGLGTAIGNSVNSAWQNYVLKKDAAKKEAEKDNIVQDTYNKEQEFEWNSATWDQRVKEIEARTDNLVKSGNLSEAKAKEVNEMLPILKDKTKAEIDVMSQQVSNLKREYDRIGVEISKIEADKMKSLQDIQESISRIELNDASMLEKFQAITESNSRIRLNESTIGLQDSQRQLNLDEMLTNDVERQEKLSQIYLNELKARREEIAVKAEESVGIPADASLGFTIRDSFKNGSLGELFSLALFFVPGGGVAKGAGALLKGAGKFLPKAGKWVAGTKYGGKVINKVGSWFGKYGTPNPVYYY